MTGLFTLLALAVPERTRRVFLTLLLAVSDLPGASCHRFLTFLDHNAFRFQELPAIQGPSEETRKSGKARKERKSQERAEKPGETGEERQDGPESGRARVRTGQSQDGQCQQEYTGSSTPPARTPRTRTPYTHPVHVHPVPEHMSKSVHRVMPPMCTFRGQSGRTRWS